MQSLFCSVEDDNTSTEYILYFSVPSTSRCKNVLITVLPRVAVFMYLWIFTCFRLSTFQPLGRIYCRRLWLGNSTEKSIVNKFEIVIMLLK